MFLHEVTELISKEVHLSFVFTITSLPNLCATAMMATAITALTKPVRDHHVSDFPIYSSSRCDNTENKGALLATFWYRAASDEHAVL
jgi:hypothetical protein